ncbi:MAG: 30S ribosomal protein S16 [Chloroflexi bacterium]|mgnify:FL=1|nr:30S ribosomal protein S16 [Chloroflexota bacterium]
MVRIRLKRVGGKKHPFYRVVVANQRAARDGAFIEQIGTYDPFPNPPEIKLDTEKLNKWISQGAQPSDSVASLLRSEGILPKISTVTPVKEAAKIAAKPAKAESTAATAVAEVPVEVEEEAPVAAVVVEDTPTDDSPVEDAKEEPTSG